MKVLIQGKVRITKLDLYDFKGESEVAVSLVLTQKENCWKEMENCIGTLVQYKDENGDTQENFAGCAGIMGDMVCWIRSFWVLDALPEISDHHHWMLHYGVNRGYDHHEEYRKELQNLIGEEQWSSIMARPFSLGELAIISNLVDAGYDISETRYSIPKEIDAGTIRWSQELKRIGIQHPDYLRAYKVAKKEVLDRYRHYIASYCLTQGVVYNPDDPGSRCMMTIGIEWGIIDCVEKGLEEQYDLAIVTALGIIFSEISNDKAMDSFYSKHPDKDMAWVKPDPETHFVEVAAWLKSYGYFFQESRLHDLYEKIPSMPIIYPLVKE